MDYNKTIDWLFSKLPYYQRKGEVAYKKDIGNIIYACKKLNNPQNKIKNVVTVVGTNAKASMATSLGIILKESGYKCNLYTSPHLQSYTERFVFNNAEINENNLAILYKWY